MEIRIWNQIIRKEGSGRYMTQEEINKLTSWGKELRHEEKVIPFGPYLDKYWQIFPDGLITLK